MRSNFYVTWHFYFIAHTHTSHQRILFIRWFILLIEAYFFSLIFSRWRVPFCVSTSTLGRFEQVWIAWIQYKIYTMLNNNYPFKLNFSKWNRISLTSSSAYVFRFGSFVFKTKQHTKKTNSMSLYDSDLAGQFFILVNFSMNYSGLHIHHYDWCAFFWQKCSFSFRMAFFFWKKVIPLLIILIKREKKCDEYKKCKLHKSAGNFINSSIKIPNHITRFRCAHTYYE